MTNSYIQVPPDSTGKRLAAREHTVDNVAVQAQLMHIASASAAANTMEIDNRGAASIRFTEGQPILSGYGTLKMSEERALGVYESSLDTYDALFSIITASGGSSTYTPAQSATVLATTTDSGSRCSRTTNRYHYYLPGSSNIARISVMCGDTGKANNKRRWGVFDDNDGLFFELNGTELRLVVRTSTLGGVHEFGIPQNTWSNDKLDGTGISGITIDVTKINNYWADYQWSGAGRVRFGIYEPSGARLVAHTITNANVYSVPLVRSGTLPFRTENINLGVTGSGSELKEICMSMHTEGTNQDYTFWRYSDMESYNVTTTTNTHILSMRSIPTVNGKHNSVQAYPETLNVSVVGGGAAVTLWQSVDVTGGTWVPGGSSLESSTVGTLSFTNSRKFKTLFFSEGNHIIDMTPFFELNDEGIMCRADGIAEVWCFTATKLSGTTVTTSVNLGYRELW